MSSEKNTIWSIQKLSEPIDTFVKIVRNFEKEHKKSTDSTANISREAGQEFLDEARIQIGKFEGFKAAVAQAIDRETDKLKDLLERKNEKLKERESEIKDLKKELKESQALAKRNEGLPDKIKKFLKEETIK